MATEAATRVTTRVETKAATRVTIREATKGDSKMTIREATRAATEALTVVLVDTVTTVPVREVSLAATASTKSTI